MRIKSIAVALALVLATFYSPMAQAAQKPVIESFTFTPNEIDITSANTKVDIELVVSHPSGIENLNSMATLANSRKDTLTANLVRIDSPINLSLTKVTYRGSLNVPRDIATGAYNFSVGTLKNNSSAGYQYETDSVDFKKLRNLVGGEYGLLVRSGGSLNLSYNTFVGPTYDSTLGIAYNDPATYNSANLPIWKVGETFTPSKYYELRVPSLTLGVASTTPLVCSSDGKQLKFLKEGMCDFNVSTPKTNDYTSKIVNQTVIISAARIKPVLAVEKIANQTSKDLPKSVEIFRVYTVSEGYVFPQSITPAVCSASGFFVRIVGGGTCTLTYQSKETETVLASDLYKVSFEVTRDPQTITFALPATVNTSVKTVPLTSTTSGGGAVTYESSTAGNCSVSGSTLTLLKSGNCSVTATQAGTSTLAPASAAATTTIVGVAQSTKKTISCVKGKTTKKVTGANPKCPAGYKLKK
jgi:hypothetical protein